MNIILYFSAVNATFMSMVFNEGGMILVVSKETGCSSAHAMMDAVIGYLWYCIMGCCETQVCHFTIHCSR